MELGVYDAVLHDRTLPEALAVVRSLGLTGLEGVPRGDDVRATGGGARRVRLEMHQFNLVFNPSTLVRLIEEAGARWIGADMDPSHLVWQGIDPVAAIEYLGPLVRHAAAKDTRINDAARIHGVLDDRHRRVSENPIRLGGDSTLNAWPENAAWDFVAPGKGHDQQFWTRFLRALAEVDPDIAVNIEHEDVELGPLEGLEAAAEVLLSAYQGI